MLPLLLTYQIGVAPINYDLRVVFTGMIPILGGNEGEADVRLGVQVQGIPGKATSELTSAKIIFNGGTLPLTLDNVKEFFPKTTVEYSPQGKITKSDAPDIELPVRLPGLDVKRFPDITYMPVEFPNKELAIGNKWSFEKSFAGSPVTYDCELTKLDEKTATINLKVEQKYTVFEDAAMQVVKDKKDAENEVATTLTAKGEAIFDRRGWIVLFKMQGDADSIVKALHEDKQTTRTLKINVEFKESKPGTPAPKTPEFRLL